MNIFYIKKKTNHKPKKHTSGLTIPSSRSFFSILLTWFKFVHEKSNTQVLNKKVHIQNSNSDFKRLIQVI